MSNVFNRLWSHLLATLLGLKCERCGRCGASLTIEADRMSREEWYGGRVVFSTFAVRRCSALCPRCR